MKSLLRKTKNGFGGGSSSKLKIDTASAEAEHDELKKSKDGVPRGPLSGVPETPPTVETTFSQKSTPDFASSSATTTPSNERKSNSDLADGGGGGLRTPSDIRSPGARQTPASLRDGELYDDEEDEDLHNENIQLIASKKAEEDAAAAVQAPAVVEDDDIDNEPALPDFMTQTDRYGNSLSKATPTSQNKTQQGMTTTGSSSAAAGSEGFIDSLRMMCCCLLLDDDATKVAGGGANAPTPTLENGMAAVQQQRSLQVTSPTAKIRNDGSSSSTAPEPKGLLPDPLDPGKKCLVLDLDETLVHSSFRAVPGADFVIPVQVENVVHSVYVAKRPYVDEFLLEMSKYYEIVVYTASLNKYADPLLDLLDVNKVIRHRLFRESCVYHDGHYVKDLSLLNRQLHQTIIVDNSPNSYVFHPESAIDCSSFIDDPTDNELVHIGEFLKGVHEVEDVRHFCQLWRSWPNIEIVNGLPVNMSNGSGGSPEQRAQQQRLAAVNGV